MRSTGAIWTRRSRVNVRAWVDGLRSPDAVDPAVRDFVGRMQREAFEIPEWDAELFPEHELSPPAARRLAEIECPVLVVVGEADQPSVIETAERIATEAPRARLVIWPDAAHMLNLERPDAFARLVRDFLEAVRDGRFDGRPSAAPESSGTSVDPGR